MNKTIASITTEVKYIALRTPFITALRRVENIEFVRVTLECSDGSIGIGEAPATFAITGEDIETILHSVQSIKDELIGLELQNAMSKLHLTSIGSSAKASLDIAILSLQNYFKIQNYESIQTDITISFNPKDTMLRDAKDAWQRGMDILKVKLGNDISHAIDVTQELSATLPHAKLLIDANQAWNLEDSLLYVNATDDLGLELIEQPVVASDLKGLKEITEATRTPILADESAFTLDEVKKIVESKSADMINIKLMKCGGVSKAIEILEYARENGVICMLGSMLEGPYSINAALYLAFNYRDVIKYVDLDSPLLYKEASSELEFTFFENSILFSGNKS